MHEIVLVGGSTRIPKIIKLIFDFVNGKEPMGLSPMVLAAISLGDTLEKTQEAHWPWINPSLLIVF